MNSNLSQEFCILLKFWDFKFHRDGNCLQKKRIGEIEHSQPVKESSLVVKAVGQGELPHLKGLYIDIVL